MTVALLLVLACAEPAPPVAPAPEPPPADEPPPTAAAPPVRNQAPRIITATFASRQVTGADAIALAVDARDPEGFELITSVDWTINGEEVLGDHGLSLPAGRVRRGDVVSGTVKVSDGLLSTSQEVGSITVSNANPIIDTDPADVRGLDVVTLAAHDPDGDPITWKVQGGPPGLSIDAFGTLHYRGTAATPAGDYVVKLIADDGMGGWGQLSVPVHVAAGSAAPKPEGAAAGAPAATAPAATP